MSRRRVVITGLGLVTPIGNDRETVLSSLREGRAGLRPVEWFPHCPVRIAGTVEDFVLGSLNRVDWRWPERYALSRELVRSLPPHGLMAICAMEQALADAHLSRAQISDGGTGLFCASAGSPRFMHHHIGEAAASQGARVHPFGVVSSIAGTLNFHLAAHYGIRGAVTGFVSACAASSHALGYAADEIMLDRHERMFVVGAEEPTWESLLPFSGMRALSRQSEPHLASRPFDAGRDGFVGAGGAAVLVLESAASAAQRGARARVELAGWGQASDGFHIAQPEPAGAGLALAMQRSLASASVTPAEIDYVHAHATSTPAGDVAEAKAIRAVFGTLRPPVSSSKALTGHTLSMAGALSAALSTLAIEEGFILGNPHLREPDPLCGDLNLPVANIARPPRVVLNNTSGFGGSNVCLILRRATAG